MKLSKKAKISFDKVVDKFQTGDLSPVIKIACFKPGENLPSSKWTFSNLLMAYLQTGSLDCRGYRQWQEVGRQVKAGSSAAFILVPNIIKKKEEHTEDPENVLIGFLTAPVFPESSTEGDPLVDGDILPKELPLLHEVADHFGCSIDYDYIPNARGFYSPTRKEIRLSTDHLKTFFHELGHLVHDEIEGVKHGQDAHQETIAEFTSAVLMMIYTGEDYTGNAWSYIASYNPKDPIEAIIKSFSMVEKVLIKIEEVLNVQT